MGKKWIPIAAAVLLVLGAVFLIAERRISRDFSDLLPENYSPEQCSVVFWEWNDVAELDSEEVQTLTALLNDLEYRYNGRVYGAMYGELYHISLFQPVENGNFSLWIAKDRKIIYTNHKEYEMVGDSGPLLEFLNDLK